MGAASVGEQASRTATSSRFPLRLSNDVPLDARSPRDYLGGHASI